MSARIAEALGVLAVTAIPAAVLAGTIEIRPGDSFEQAAEALRPGDTLILHAGDYFDTGRISITVQGTASNPVTIRGADGEALPHIGRASGAAVQNTINIEGARYLTLSRLEISGNGGDAINLNGDPAFISIENLEIHDIDVGVNFRSSMNNIVVRHSHIHDTGAGGGTGEGMYVGCNDATCIVSNSVFENNWIHDTRNSTQGDGIEVKLGSHSNLVRDNVIYNTGYPCILVYGTQGAPVNIIEGNVVWNCGDSGIQAAADAIIRDNLILDNSGNGFNSQPHQAAVPSNLQFVHNTLVGGNPCIRLSSWDGRPGLVIANNAIYCPSGQFAIGGLAGVTIAGNVMSPAVPGFPSSGNKTGAGLTQDLLNAAQHDVYPTSTSALVDAGASAYRVAQDFNGRVRSDPPEAGAYEWSGAANPGWVVREGFKNVSATAPAPTVNLSATPGSVAVNGTSQLVWSTSDATTCSGSGGTAGWAGSKPLQGSANVGPLTTATSFGLSCTGAGGTTQKSVTVNITTAPGVNFSANPTAVNAGQSSTLTWSSANATGCAASDGWAGNKATSGSESTGALSATKNYTLACTGSGGTTQRSVTVAVNGSTPGAPPVTLLLSADPASVSANGTTTLTWSSTNATSCTASGAWSGSKMTSGNETTPSLTSTSTFTLDCTGTGAPAQKSVTVAVTSGNGGVAPTPPANSGGGGGGLDQLSIAFLLGLLRLQLGRPTKRRLHLDFGRP